MKKTQKPLKANSQELMQIRPYDSKETMRIDMEQFLGNPDAFTGKLPRPGDWRLKAKVIKADPVLGNPPEKKHELHLTILAEGSQKDIDSWQSECTKMFTAGKRGSVSSELGKRYMSGKNA